MPGPVFLRGEGIELRTIEKEDAEFLAASVNDPAVRNSMSMTDPVSVGSEDEWIESLWEEDDVHLLLCDDGEPVGNVSLHHLRDRHGTAEIGYWVAPDHQGQGYATSATRLILDYAFNERGLARVGGRAFATNEASQRVLEKAGFVEEGLTRQDVFLRGERVDTVDYGILAEEFEP